MSWTSTEALAIVMLSVERRAPPWHEHAVRVRRSYPSALRTSRLSGPHTSLPFSQGVERLILQMPLLALGASVRSSSQQAASFGIATTPHWTLLRCDLEHDHSPSPNPELLHLILILETARTTPQHKDVAVLGNAKDPPGGLSAMRLPAPCRYQQHCEN